MTDDRLDGYLPSYTRFNDWLIRRRYQAFAEFFVGSSCLEMGSAEGSGTQYLLDHFPEVVSVDGSRAAVDSLRRRFPTDRHTAVHGWFEDLDLGGRLFDTVVLAHVLEHVDDPLPVLARAREHLAPGGVLVIDVPNGNSLHRQVGVKLGMLSEVTQLNEADHSIGHQRVYVPETFRRDVESAGLTIQRFGGMFVKVLSNAQTEQVFSAEQLEALFAVGEDNPDVAAEMYILATA